MIEKRILKHELQFQLRITTRDIKIIAGRLSEIIIQQ